MTQQLCNTKNMSPYTWTESPLNHPEVGQIVQVRSRQYLVEDVQPPIPGPEDTLVRLSCIEDDAQGDRLEVLWERELDARILQNSSWKEVTSRGFDSPELFSAYLHTLRWNCVTSTEKALFQAPYRAGIEIMAYQLEPLRKALQMPRVNLFIADDVGLGKTIEAGLIVRELLIRQKVRRIVIACPPSVVVQWKDEMERRFGLGFVIYDRAFVASMRQERGYGINPWETHHQFIISQSLLRDEQYAAPLRQWLGDSVTGSMLILDEAHNAAPASAAKYAIDSRLTRVVRDIAPRFEHRLFLSATPHNGHSNSFAALLEILDPQRFCRGVPIRKNSKDLNAVMVRRLKGDLRSLGSNFPLRKVIKVSIDQLPQDAPELTLSQLLQAYRDAKETRLQHATRNKQTTAMLVLASLQKRLLSSIYAFARTLKVHQRALLQKQQPTTNTPEEKDTQQALPLDTPDADDDRAELPEEDVQAEDDAQISSATEQTSDEASLMAPELQLVQKMLAIAEGARYRVDGRIQHIIAWLREHLCQGIASNTQDANPNASWADKRVIIFTEYTDTKTYLVQQLQTAIEGTHLAEKRIETFHGGMGEERREEIKRAFNAAPDAHPLRILIATDAAREGVNLQNYCADLFHFDIPWNPSRMEQRNGRIDRKLQREDEVRCYYFVLPQRAEDRVLDVLVSKTKTIQEELGSLSPVLERRLNKTLRKGIHHKDAETLRTQISFINDNKDDELTQKLKTTEDELESARQPKPKLEKDLKRLRTLLKTSRDWLGLNDTLFREALSSSLTLLGVPPLQKHDTTQQDEFASWHLPSFDTLAGKDPTWLHTLDSLRAPRKRKQNLREWRRESPILPVIFRDSGQLEAQKVHLHLEHRLTQRLLGRFRSQGFVHDDLSRACVCMTDDPIPKVILLGRLSLYGHQAARLHDELVLVAAEWGTSLARSTKKLQPLGIRQKENLLQLLEASLASERLRHTTQHVRSLYLNHIQQDVDDLLPELTKRAEKLQEQAESKLTKRGKEEAKEMVEILKSQRQRIEEENEKFNKGGTQLLLGFEKQARAQLEADKKYWQKRLSLIELELQTEPERIRRTYEVKATRIEPVGVVYLAPISG